MDSFNFKRSVKDANEEIDPSKDEEFKKQLVREVARTLKEKETGKLLWSKLENKTGRNCKLLWTKMANSTTQKLFNLLPANDLVDNLSTEKQPTALDWLLFDLILVHEKINITKGIELPQCIHKLYQLVQDHKVEDLYGNELVKAWICVTLEYNTGGRLCSPMFLQLRWYQLKEMSRQQVYKPSKSQHPAKTKLLHAIAIKYQKIITRPFSRWGYLIKEGLLILPEQFVDIINRGNTWKHGKADESWYLQINTEAYDNLMKCYIKTEKNHETSFAITNKTIEIEKSNHQFKTNTIVNVDSDDVIDDILPKKATVIINSNAGKTFNKDNSRNVVETPVNNKRNKTKILSSSENEAIDIEINKILQEKIKLIPEVGLENIDNIVTLEEKKNLKRKNWQIIDEDAQLVDESVESSEGIKKRLKRKTACLSSNYDDNATKGHNNVDPKLLMRAIVSTTKLDSMNVFKYIDYKCVKDKNVIDCAIFQSKSKFKHVFKTEHVTNNYSGTKLFLNQYIKSNHNYSDMAKITQVKAYNTIKSTSWLLQKPKKRKYNVMKLCNNPDFNNKLKSVTPAFLSSYRNIVFLNQCKPLTIDLHKQFENKLIKGTCKILEVQSTKSTDNSNLVAAKETDQIIENNTSTKVLKHNPVDRTLPGSSSEIRPISSQTVNNRRKRINLPNIDQVRKVNQSLLTAEVTPIRNSRYQT